MSIEQIIVTSLLFSIMGTSLSVMFYWHIVTKGSWSHWPAGRSLMGLLLIIAVGHGWGGANRVLGDYIFKQSILTCLYAVFAVGLLVIGLTIRKEMAAGKAARVTVDNQPADTGVIAVVLASNPEEHSNDA